MYSTSHFLCMYIHLLYKYYVIISYHSACIIEYTNTYTVLMHYTHTIDYILYTPTTYRVQVLPSIVTASAPPGTTSH